MSAYQCCLPVQGHASLFRAVSAFNVCVLLTLAAETATYMLIIMTIEPAAGYCWWHQTLTTQAKSSMAIHFAENFSSQTSTSAMATA